MAILVRDDGGGAPTPAPTQPPPPAPPVQPPVIAPVQPVAPAFASPSGSGDEGARGLPQQGVGPVGPIVEPHPQAPPPVPAPPPVAPVAPTEPAPASPSGASEEEARGMPQQGSGRIGPIVEPHGPPSPPETPPVQHRTAAPPTSGGGGGGEPTGTGEPTRTLESAFAPDNRDQAAIAWLRLQQFFSTLIPHDAHELKKASAMLPKVVR